jgi:hypothetical protein
VLRAAAACSVRAAARHAAAAGNARDRSLFGEIRS